MLENVLVSLHSLKPMGLDPFGASTPLFLRHGELLGHSPIHNLHLLLYQIPPVSFMPKVYLTYLQLKIAKTGLLICIVTEIDV